MNVTKIKSVNSQNSDYCVVSASKEDIPAIQELLTHYASLGDLLPRTKTDLAQNIEHFRLIKKDGVIVACGSLENFTEELAEIRSLMVDKTMKGKGLGAILVNELTQLAQSRKVKRLMALTYVPVFFHKMGFKTVNKNIFPEKVWGICVNCYKFENCDEIAVLKELT